MDREQLLNLINSFGLPNDSYYILSSGALVLFGLREKAGDLDICVSEKLFETLKQRYHLTEDMKNSHGFYTLSDNVEIVVDFKFDFTYKDGYPVQKLESILKFKEKRNAPKDQADIIRIKEYLAGKQ